MARRIIFWLVLTILIIALLIVLRLITNPRSIVDDGAEIREILLMATPIGSTEEEVMLFIDKHSHWEIRRRTFGTFGNGLPIWFEYGDMAIDKETDNIQVRMESQRSGLTSREISYAIWRFDENGRLIDILTQVSVYQYYNWF